MLVDNNLVHTACPLCGSRDIHKQGAITCFQPVLYSTNEITLKETPELWICATCRSGFTSKAVPEHESARLYAAGAGAERWTSSPFENEKAPDVIRILKKMFRPGLRVLDIGCNTGELLDFAGSLGCITAGVEYSTSSREIVISKGHGCYAALDEVAESYDVITAFDLVEHLYDMSCFFSFCREKLSTNGRAVILTGNFSCFSAHASGADWWYIGYPEHIVFPSKKFFHSLPQLAVEQWLETYASTKFNASFKAKLLTLIKGKQRGNYNALPSLVPDHVLVVLKKC